MALIKRGQTFVSQRSGAQIFSVPATTAGVERLFSIAGYILSCRRLSFIDRNFEDQVFARCNSDLLANASRKRKPDAD